MMQSIEIFIFMIIGTVEGNYYDVKIFEMRKKVASAAKNITDIAS